MVRVADCYATLKCALMMVPESFDTSDSFLTCKVLLRNRIKFDVKHFKKLFTKSDKSDKVDLVVTLLTCFHGFGCEHAMVSIELSKNGYFLICQMKKIFRKPKVITRSIQGDSVLLSIQFSVTKNFGKSFSTVFFFQRLFGSANFRL